MATTIASRAVSSGQALTIADLDARSVYRDVTKHRIEVTLQTDGWHVDYFVPDGWHGGGPHYVIDAETGAILYKRYDQ